MLISLLIYLLISNALSLRKDKSILFSRIVMVSLILTSFLAFNNQSHNIIIFLLCGMIGLILYKNKNRAFILFYIITTNIYLMLIIYSVVFSIACLMYNISFLLEGYMI